MTSVVAMCVTAACAFLNPSSAVPGTSNRMIPREFEIKLLDATVINSKDIQGKVAVIDFWGTWCKPCLAEIPEYNAFYRDYKDKDVVFIALAGDSGGEDKVREAARRFKIEYPVAAPSRKELKVFGKIRAYPTTLVIGPEGAIEREFVGVVAGKVKAIRGIVDLFLKEKTKNSMLR